jgi:hypothetical protein
MIKFRYLFHGDGAIYLTTHPLVALIEAMPSVSGEENLRPRL